MGGRSSGSGAATSVATRRKSEERVGGNTKKSKQEASHKTSPPKVRNHVKIGMDWRSEGVKPGTFEQAF